MPTAAGRLHRGTDEDVRQVLRTPFALTRAVRAPGVRRLRVSDATGPREWRFDLVTNVRWFANGDSVADNYSAAVVELPVRFDGRVGFARRGFLRSPVKLDAPPATAGSAKLHRRYDVRTTSPELATLILGGPLDEWLCSARRSFHYELVHDRVLAYGWRRYIGGNAVLRAAEAFAARVVCSPTLDRR